MPRRTPRAAQAIVDATPGLSPAARKQYQATIDEAKAMGESIRRSLLSARGPILQHVGSQGFDLAEEVREECAALAADVRAGRISLPDARKAHARLAAQLTTAAEHRVRFETTVASFAQMETDPEEWVESFLLRYPMIQPEFDI
ncbi:MAG: hypothetical protein AB7L17_16930 [Ilumatobacteraceae bacterium]